MDKVISISPSTLSKLIANKELFLLFDLRSQEKYNHGHITGASHAVCDSNTKETIMPKIPKNIKIILVDDDGTVSKETAEMMRTMQFDSYYLDGGMNNWNGNIVSGSISDTISSVDLWKKLNDKDEYDSLLLLDVREPEEYADFRIAGSINLPLQELTKKENLDNLPHDKQIITICPHGNRAKIASFMLENNNIESKTLKGGLANWNQVLIDRKDGDSDPLIIQVHKIGKGCLSHIVVSEKEAVVIDPLYPIEKYLEISTSEGFKITKVLNTHQHADHISAAKDLAQISGAEWYESGYESWDFPTKFLKDKDVIKFGNSFLKVIHTPGHTPGSLCYLVNDKYLFTGDILFIESVGRPDLRDKIYDFSHDLYHSLHNKIFKLPLNVNIYPTHHGESVSPNKDGIYKATIEIARKNKILELSENDFVNEIVKISTPRPKNYTRIIQINKGVIPLHQEEIPNLELGPNRCSIQ